MRMILILLGAIFVGGCTTVPVTTKAQTKEQQQTAKASLGFAEAYAKDCIQRTYALSKIIQQRMGSDPTIAKMVYEDIEEACISEGLTLSDLLYGRHKIPPPRNEKEKKGESAPF